MSKKLIIVESPAKAKTIAKYAGDEYIVISSKGHIMDLVTESNDMGVDIEDNFKTRYKIIPEKKDVVKTIVDAANKASEILLASDPDREGEAIAFHIKSQIKKSTAPIKRVEFKEITKAGVKYGISHPRELDNNLFDAQQARRVLDRIVGFVVSKFLMDSFGPGFSAGRVQSVALRLIVEREREIENFKPEEYWTLHANLAKNKEKLIAKYAGKVSDQKNADKIKNDLENDTYSVSEVINDEQKKNPFPPLITSTLTASVSSRYKFPAAKTMKVAQTLYESGMITYMRTDSVRNSPESIQSCREYLESRKLAVPDKPNTFKSKGNAQDAHEAIRPTDVFKHPDSIFLPEDEKKVYRVIWEHFVASQMAPAIFDTCNVTVKTSSGHLLKANGRVLKFKGWLEIMSDEDDNDGDNHLPILNVGDKLDLVPPKIKSEKKQTKPPPRWSERTLVLELEKKGIGRPATYAAIMSKITDRHYVTVDKNVFYATENGKKAIDKLSSRFQFMEYRYTSEIEEQLEEIANSKAKYVNVLNNFYNLFKKELKSAYTLENKDYGFKCNKCQQPMFLKHGKFGFYLACANYPECKTTFSCELIDEKPVIKNSSPIVDGISCPKCSSTMIKKDGKFGPFYSCSNYPKCTGNAKVPFGKKCNQCGGELYLTVFNEEPKLACMQYPACRNVEEVPSDSKVNWVPPNKIVGPKMDKSIKKIIEDKKNGKK